MRGVRRIALGAGGRKWQSPGPAFRLPPPWVALRFYHYVMAKGKYQKPASGAVLNLKPCLDRRRYIRRYILSFIVQHLRRGGLICATLWFAGGRLEAGGEPVCRVKIQVDTQTVVSRIAPDFMGLGYETSAVAQSNYFSAKNTTLVHLYQNLSPNGLIRIGGNISDHTQYIPDGVAKVQTEEGVTVINQASLVELGKFVRATGWKVMWGLNLRSSSPAAAAREARAVNAALGSALHSFEIGNEVDFQSQFANSYEAYHTAYLAYKLAIRSALPQAPFSGPDVGGSLDWLTAFAATEAKDVKLLTHHYYRSGADNPKATIETLLKHDDQWDVRLDKLQAISRNEGVSYRINEVNSFSGGGKTGVSDTFAAALWCLDYMFELASHGGAGINVETDINQHAWISHYSPIVHDATGHCHAQPEYYGMLAFALAGKGDLLKLTLDKGEINLSAHATKDKRGRLWLTVVNRDLMRDAEVEAVLPAGFATAAAFRLKAPAVNSLDQVTFAGAEVSTNGRWTAGMPERLAVSQGAVHLQVPHASAVLVRVQAGRDF